MMGGRPVEEKKSEERDIAKLVVQEVG